MLFYAWFAVINGLFRFVGQFVPRTSLSLRQAARGMNSRAPTPNVHNPRMSKFFHQNRFYPLSCVLL
jgi:hypothetical protein